MKRLVIIGGSGSIGKAFVNFYSNQVDVKKIYCFSRTDQTHSSEKVINKKIDIEDEESIKNAGNYHNAWIHALSRTAHKR